MTHFLPALAIAILLLLPLAVMPVQADAADDFIEGIRWGASMAIRKVEQGRPVFLSSSQDYINEGNYWKGMCEEKSRLYNEKLSAFVQKSQQGGSRIAYDPAVLQASMEQKDTFSVASGFYMTDPGAKSLYADMKNACEEAEKNYNKAFEETPERDYDQQAEIFDEAAGIYDARGDSAGAAQVRQAATAAEARAAARDTGFSDCLIVTATFGSPMAGEVQLVRDFRDDTIKQDYLGSRYVTALNAIYYSFSPAVARAIDGNPAVKPAMRFVLAPLIGIVLLSQGMYSLMSFSPEIATVAFIIFGGALVGLVYFMPLVIAALWVAGRKKWRVPALSGLKPVVFIWAGLLAALMIGSILRLDLITIPSSGLLFACTVLLAAGAAALYLSRHLGISHPAQNE